VSFQLRNSEWLGMTSGKFRTAAEHWYFHLLCLLSPRERFRSTPSTRLAFKPTSFFRRRIWWASSNTTTSTALELVRRAAPLISVFRGRCGFRSSRRRHRLRSHNVQSTTVPNNMMFIPATVSLLHDGG
jgi:hypothetical protein